MDTSINFQQGNLIRCYVCNVKNIVIYWDINERDFFKARRLFV